MLLFILPGVLGFLADEYSCRSVDGLVNLFSLVLLKRESLLRSLDSSCDSPEFALIKLSQVSNNSILLFSFYLLFLYLTLDNGKYQDDVVRFSFLVSLALEACFVIGYVVFPFYSFYNSQ